MKHGVLLTGGEGTRLFPLTKVINKHLLGVNGKFVIDYPIESLKSLGCTDITVVLGGSHYSQIVGYLGDGKRYDLNFNFILQEKSLGISHAISLCKNFVYNENNFSIVLGDNWFEKPLKWKNATNSTAQIMLANHYDLKRFGVASLDKKNNIVKIEEKPKELDNNYNNFAISGCYLFTSQYFDFFEQSKLSQRGEFEICDIIQMYLNNNNLKYGYTNGQWSDLGTHESIAKVNNYLFNKNQ